ncbi:hypothetical protein J2857_001864 [Neorhizobium galegae]|uniref:hypothetical protein n=1 Tax=Neorhizobium galegae TaxID=399 RepID=UPI001AE3FB8D|nr:hypothetical protein [Neorhizobium galegae]MBP2559113.1 hypothetical protein [Neorhizobium galegae]
MSDKKPPPIETYLAARTAEMLALPYLACRRRDCRRLQTCYWRFNATGEPCCLQNLDAGQRRVFDELYDQARRIRDHGGWNARLMYASRYPVRRALEDAGLEIAGTMVHNGDRKRWNAFRRKRAALTPEELD